MTPEEAPRLEAYHFHERDWEGYDRLCESFEREVPERFNMARYVCDRWADDRGRVALFGADGAGGRETVTYGQLRSRADALANHLAERGVGRGDRVGVNLPQKPATVVAHVAVWKLGAVSVPRSTLFGTEGMRYRLADAGATACVVDGSNVETLRAVADDLPDLETGLTADVADPHDGETPLKRPSRGPSGPSRRSRRPPRTTPSSSTRAGRPATRRVSGTPTGCCSATCRCS